VVLRARYSLARQSLPVVMREEVLDDLVRALFRVRPIGSAPAPLTFEPETIDRQEHGPGAATPETGPATSEPAPAMITVEKTAPPPPRAFTGVQAGVGPSLLGRTLGFDVASAPSYSGGVVFGIRAEGTVFPLALSNELASEHPVLASFGFAGSYEHVFAFNTSSMGGRSSGTASRWNVMFVGRAPLGRHARGGVLIIDSGLVQMSWAHAAPVDVGIPDVRYDLVGGGLGWERALGTRFVILGLRVGVLGLLSAGDIASDAQYGSTTGWALQVAGSWTARPREWLWLRVLANWDRIALSFAGSGTRFAHSGVDSWAGGALEVGFAL
jgi:hypothetical protein